MRSPRNMAICPIIFLIFVPALLGLSSCKGSALTVTMEKIDEAIRKELPIGSNKSQALEFLDSYAINSLKFDHSDFRDDPELISLLIEYDNFDDKPKKLSKNLKGIIEGAIYRVEHDSFTSTSILVRFYFDNDENLIDYTLKKRVDE